ncbi:MAG TPA: MarR family winged helix-turn-helix transcriptional regulator [Casimicrobiaceae bacterium]|nr:MarR family winged helix-turn-helix transcriptional regulator [Casimicrobiaceae bacterium]
MPPSKPASRPAPADGADASVERALHESAGHCVCGNLRMAARLVTAHYDAALRPCGIEANQMAMLWVIHAGEPLASSRVAHGMGIDQSTASRNLAVLEGRGLVRSEPSRDDRRQRVVRLTAQGRRTLIRAYPLWQKAQAEVGRLTADLADVGAIGRTLRRVTRRLQASDRG